MIRLHPLSREQESKERNYNKNGCNNTLYICKSIVLFGPNLLPFGCLIKFLCVSDFGMNGARVRLRLQLRHVTVKGESPVCGKSLDNLLYYSISKMSF
jgi:hypothetical protein